MEKRLNVYFGGISDNPSVSFADSSLYTREPVLKQLQSGPPYCAIIILASAGFGFLILIGYINFLS